MKPSRRRKGSLIAIGAVMLLVLSLVAVFGGQTIWSYLQHERYRQALESAALKAASDLSEIVINDPYFGFVSLSDRPAAGNATIAEDGEPVPVHGINSLIAASRLDYLIASELGDERLQSFALEDARHAREAANKLTEVLSKSLSPDSKDAKDMDGNVVRPYVDAINAYQDSLKCFTQDPPQEFQLELGWLTKVSATVTPLPFTSPNLPGLKATALNDIAINGYYKANVDVPSGSEHLFFAGLGSQPSLVDAGAFVPTDREHISTVVRAQAKSFLPNFLGRKGDAQELITQACGQAYALDRKPAPSVLVLTFPDGLPPGVDTMHDILTNPSLNESAMRSYVPVGSDYAMGNTSQLQPRGVRGSAAGCFALALHDWLRNNYALPKVDSMLGILNTSLSRIAGPGNTMFALGMAADGTPVLTQLSRKPFADRAVEDQQLFLTTDEPIMIGNRSWMVTCRDQVRIAGTIAGGRHAGQPLPADPINWDGLDTFVSQSFARASASRRPGGIVANGILGPLGDLSFDNAQLQRKDGRTLSHGLRRSSYSAGLAAELLICTARRPLP
jgi:hypothetical protein